MFFLTTAVIITIYVIMDCDMRKTILSMMACVSLVYWMNGAGTTSVSASISASNDSSVDSDTGTSQPSFHNVPQNQPVQMSADALCKKFDEFGDIHFDIICNHESGYDQAWKLYKKQNHAYEGIYFAKRESMSGLAKTGIAVGCAVGAAGLLMLFFPLSWTLLLCGGTMFIGGALGAGLVVFKAGKGLSKDEMKLIRAIVSEEVPCVMEGYYKKLRAWVNAEIARVGGEINNINQNISYPEKCIPQLKERLKQLKERLKILQQYKDALDAFNPCAITYDFDKMSNEEIQTLWKKSVTLHLPFVRNACVLPQDVSSYDSKIQAVYALLSRMRYASGDKVFLSADDVLCNESIGDYDVSC